MPFGYYSRLSRGQQRVYRESDAVSTIAIPEAPQLYPLVAALGEALALGNRARVQSSAGHLLAEIAARLGVAPLRATVLTVRPSHAWGELYGLYNGASARRTARVSVWMQTARRRQVVRFRTFLRTLPHELCHHLDYTFLHLSDSFHTEGFYQRESSLLRQLLPPAKVTEGAHG